MCSLICNYNGNDDETSDNAKDSLKDTILCRKCRCKDVDVLLIGQSGYCETCFLNITNHKFRASLGKSKIIRHGDTILVDHTGELNSTVLLHLIRASMSEKAYKKFIFNIVVLYIDDGVVMEKTNKEKDILRHKIAEEIKETGYNGYIVSFSQVLNKIDDLDIKPMDHQEINNENDDQLCAILTSLSDDTSRIDLLSQLRRKLLLSAARKLNCNKVFVADSAMDIAIKALGDICLGRGAQLSTLANFCDIRCADIKILKPMRDFTQQELLYYSQYHKINFIKLKESIGTTSATSIQALAYNFTTGLQSEFSSTVSTVFRTAEKISARNNEQQNGEDNCVLCDARLESMSLDDQVSATRAIELSKYVSSKSNNSRIPSSSSNKENGGPNCTIPRLSNAVCCNDNTECDCKDNKKRQITAKDVWKCLCYSCRLIFRGSEILQILPAPLLFAVQQRVSLKNMKEEIKDFLL